MYPPEENGWKTENDYTPPETSIVEKLKISIKNLLDIIRIFYGRKDH